MLRNVICVGAFASAIIFGLACGADSNGPEPTGGRAGKGDTGGPSIASYFETLSDVEFARHQPEKELSCEGAPVTNAFQGYDSAHSYSFAAEPGVQYQIRMESTHEKEAGIVAAVYHATNPGNVIAFDYLAKENSIKLPFKLPDNAEEVEKVIVVVFSLHFRANGDYNLSVSCDSTGPAFCSTDPDCPSGFCGCVDANCASRVCKPFAKWGDSCGNFALPPHLAARCAPRFVCAGGDPQVDKPSRCSAPATVAEIMDPMRIDEFDGKPVVISQAELRLESPSCSRCFDPHCICSSSLRMFDAFTDSMLSLGLMQTEQKPYSCEWKKDEPASVTCDLSIWTPEAIYWVAGVVKQVPVWDAPTLRANLLLTDVAFAMTL